MYSLIKNYNTRPRYHMTLSSLIFLLNEAKLEMRNFNQFSDDYKASELIQEHVTYYTEFRK